MAQASDVPQVVAIIYMNHRGETATRHILPQKIWFGSTQWHPEPQWLLEAFDVGKQAMRSFAMRDISHWSRD